jgi:hypothetical protein
MPTSVSEAITLCRKPATALKLPPGGTVEMFSGVGWRKKGFAIHRVSEAESRKTYRDLETGSRFRLIRLSGRDTWTAFAKARIAPGEKSHISARLQGTWRKRQMSVQYLDRFPESRQRIRN